MILEDIAVVMVRTLGLRQLVDGPGNAWEILGNENMARAPELSGARVLVVPRIPRAIV
jgi:hypothetical protein